MNIRVEQGNITQQACDCIVVNLFEGVTIPGGATGAVDQALGGAISRLVTTGDFTGKAGTTALLYTNGQLPAPRVLVVGLGDAAKFDINAVRKTAGAVTKALAQVKPVRRFATIVHGAGIGGLDAQACSQAVAEGALLAAYQPPNYKREAPAPGPDEAIVVEFDSARLAAVTAGVRRGAEIAAGVMMARDLTSEPPNVLNPVEFARRARVMAAEVGMGCTVLGETEMRAEKMNILLGVSQGSANEAQLIILEHAPAGTEQQPPLVLVGKGITFDTGGISIKPGDRMEEMKGDMSGAGAVISALGAVARLGVQRRVIGVAACVENMPDGNAYRPGDILVGITGKSAEIINTDAEGRLVLADALGYVARFQPKAVVDLATLTGAIGIALGQQAAGCFSNNAGLQEALLEAAQRTGERLWPMPMWDEYTETIKSDMAEVKNSAGRASGVSSSAKFLEHFTEGYPWAHLDIASMVLSGTEKDAYTPKGATGYGVRLLVDLAENY